MADHTPTFFSPNLRTRAWAAMHAAAERGVGDNGENPPPPYTVYARASDNPGDGNSNPPLQTSIHPRQAGPAQQAQLKQQQQEQQQLPQRQSQDGHEPILSAQPCTSAGSQESGSAPRPPQSLSAPIAPVDRAQQNYHSALDALRIDYLKALLARHDTHVTETAAWRRKRTLKRAASQRARRSPIEKRQSPPSPLLPHPPPPPPPPPPPQPKQQQQQQKQEEGQQAAVVKQEHQRERPPTPPPPPLPLPPLTVPPRQSTPADHSPVSASPSSQTSTGSILDVASTGSTGATSAHSSGSEEEHSNTPPPQANPPRPQQHQHQHQEQQVLPVQTLRRRPLTGQGSKSSSCGFLSSDWVWDCRDRLAWISHWASTPNMSKKERLAYLRQKSKMDENFGRVAVAPSDNNRSWWPTAANTRWDEGDTVDQFPKSLEKALHHWTPWYPGQNCFQVEVENQAPNVGDIRTANKVRYGGNMQTVVLKY